MEIIVALVAIFIIIAIIKSLFKLAMFAGIILLIYYLLTSGLI